MGLITNNEAEIIRRLEEQDKQLREQCQLLTRIERMLAGQKETLTLEEASAYSGISKSYLYKLTASGTIPHYKPEGKIIYFDRSELNAWLKRNRIKTVAEIEQEAITFVSTKRSKGAGR